MRFAIKCIYFAVFCTRRGAIVQLAFAKLKTGLAHLVVNRNWFNLSLIELILSISGLGWGFFVKNRRFGWSWNWKMGLSSCCHQFLSFVSGFGGGRYNIWKLGVGSWLKFRWIVAESEVSIARLHLTSVTLLFRNNIAKNGFLFWCFNFFWT